MESRMSNLGYSTWKCGKLAGHQLSTDPFNSIKGNTL